MDTSTIIIILLTLNSLYCMLKGQTTDSGYSLRSFAFIPLNRTDEKNLSSYYGFSLENLDESDKNYQETKCLKTPDDAKQKENMGMEHDYFFWFENHRYITQKNHKSNMGLMQDITWKEKLTNNTTYAMAMKNVKSGSVHEFGCHETYNGVCILDIKFVSELSDLCPADHRSSDSPIRTCLKEIKSKIGLTASEVVALCQQHSGYLLEQGYTLSRFSAVKENKRPFRMDSGQNGIQQSKSHSSEILERKVNDINETSSLSIENEKSAVDKQFCKIICEYSPKIPDKKMIITLKYVLDKFGGYEKQLELEVKGESTNIMDLIFLCFTDAGQYLYNQESLPITWGEKVFIDADNDGYYWCIVIETDSYQHSVSNKILFISSSEASKNKKAYLLGFSKEMNYDDIDESIERTFPYAEIKMRYEKHKALVHSTPPITTNSKITILYQRNLQQCEEFKQFPKTDIGKTVADEDLFSTTYYKCEGDYNVGAFWEKVKTVNKTTDFPSTPMSSKDVIDTVHTMLGSPVNVEKLENAVNYMNNVLILKNTEISQTFAKIFDDLVNAVEIPSGQAYIKIIRSNIAVLVAKRDGPNPVVGIKVRAIENMGINDQTIYPIVEGDFLDPNLFNSDNDVVATVAASVCRGDGGKISFTLFRDDAAFPNEKNSAWKVNSRVLSISLHNKTCLEKPDYVEIHFRPYGNRQSNKKKACAHWDFAQGNWSTDTCILMPLEDLRQLDICRCYHLSHFAQIVTYADLPSEEKNKIFISILKNVSATALIIGLIVVFWTVMIS